MYLRTTSSDINNILNADIYWITISFSNIFEQSCWLLPTFGQSFLGVYSINNLKDWTEIWRLSNCLQLNCFLRNFDRNIFTKWYWKVKFSRDDTGRYSNTNKNNENPIFNLWYLTVNHIQKFLIWYLNLYNGKVTGKMYTMYHQLNFFLWFHQLKIFFWRYHFLKSVPSGIIYWKCWPSGITFWKCSNFDSFILQISLPVSLIVFMFTERPCRRSLKITFR